jgi:hypothetical protein
MTIQQKIASTLIALAFVIIIFYLVRNRRLGEDFALIWAGCALGMLGVIWFYSWLVFVTYLIGAVMPTTTLFLFGVLFMLLLCLKFSINLSRHKTQIKDLTQRLALMEAQQEEQNHAKPEAAKEVHEHPAP